MRAARQGLRSLLLALGYRVDCIRSIPRQLLDETLTRKLEFEDVVSRRMVELGRSLRFIQVGAFDGQTRDPLFPFIRDHGWTGVLVEPQRSACESLRTLHRDRPGIRIVNAAIGVEEGRQTLYRVEGSGLPEWCGGLASFDRASIVKHESLVPGLSQHIVAEEVPTISFAKLLTEAGFPEIDLLQVDTEGADALILGWFPFQRIRPAIVHFEIKHLDKPQREHCLVRLASFGYQFAFSGGEDLMAVMSHRSPVANER